MQDVLPLLAASATALALGTAGCQGYQARPLDLGAMLESWQRLKPDREEPVERARASGEHFDARDGIELREAEWIALVFAPPLQSQRLEVQVAMAGAGHVAPLPNPVLDVDVHRVVENVQSPWLASNLLSFTIPLSGKRGAAQAIADAEVAVARASLRAAEWRLLARLRRGWVQWTVAEQHLEAMKTYLASLRRMEATALHLERKGEIEPGRVGVLSLEAATVALELRSHRRVAARLRHELLETMGLAPGAPAELTPLPNVMAAPAIDKEALSERNPDVVLARTRYDAAEQTVRLEVAKQFPDLVIGPSFEADGGLLSLGLGMGLPLPVFSLNRRGIAVARAAREVARARVETALKHAVWTLSQSRADLTAAEQRAEHVRKTLLPLAARQLDQLDRLARAGEVDPLVVQQVLSTQMASHLALLNALRDVALARIELEALVWPAAPNQKEAP